MGRSRSLSFRASRQTGPVTTRRVLVLFAALAFSACTQEAAVTPSSVPLDASSTTTEPPPATTTTIAPDTTPAPDTTVVETTSTAAETTVAPTTTSAATGNPTSVSTEYYLGGDPDAWLYLGRWTGNSWETDRGDDQQLREPTAANGDAVLIHELDVVPISGTVDGSGEACSSDGRAGPVIAPNARVPQDPGYGYRSIAFPADWSTEPRPVAVVEASVESYVAAGREAFADFGIDTSSGAIAQLAVTDLDGDGDTEAVVAFDGDSFSALLLIDADSGSSITLARSVTTTVTPTTVAAGDAPGEPTTSPFETYRTLALADLNGDGRFEIVAHAFEGGSAEVTVNVYDGTEVTPVLTAGC